MAHGRFIFSNYLEEALMPKTLGTPITPPVLLFSRKYCPSKKILQRFSILFANVKAGNTSGNRSIHWTKQISKKVYKHLLKLL